MKKYNKPMMEIVELQSKENIAKAVNPLEATTVENGVATTVYRPLNPNLPNCLVDFTAYIQEQSRQSILPGLKLFYEAPPLAVA